MDVSCVANITIQLWSNAIYICNASKIFAVGFSEKKGFITSTGTGLSKRLTGFNVPVTTSSSVLFSQLKFNITSEESVITMS
jgi:hypothetical protein